MDLLFRNVTDVTERKAQRVVAVKGVKNDPAASAGYDRTISRLPNIECDSSMTPLLPPSFMQCPEQEALCFWFLNFVMLPRHPESLCGYMEYLLPLYNDTKVDSPLSLVTLATALAAFGKIPGKIPSKRILPMAKKAYSRALTAIKKAVCDPVEAKNDDTLIAVLFLSIYEVSIILFSLTSCPEQAFPGRTPFQ